MRGPCAEIAASESDINSCDGDRCASQANQKIHFKTLFRIRKEVILSELITL